MVFINRQAVIDLDNIVIGLLEWNKVALTISEVLQYTDDIVNTCYQLDGLIRHSRAKYKDHLKYGAYSFQYRRNKKTTWYLIYNIDSFGNIFVNKIMSNHLTLS
jgi:hypothetical protein